MKDSCAGLQSGQLDLLLVEDDVASAALIQAMLAESAPTAVTTAGDLRGAVEHLRSQAYDCVILDLNLPDGRGAEVVDAIRAVNPDVPTLILSGMEGSELTNIAARSTAQGSLSKNGIDADLLWSAVASAIGRASDHSQRERMEALVRLASIATSMQDRIDSALALGAEALNMPVGIVAEIDSDNYRVQTSVGGGDALAVGTTFDLADTYCALTWRADQAVVIHHMAASPYTNAPCYEAFGLESYIGAPLRVAGRRVGSVSFSSPLRRTTPFTRDDVKYIQHLAGLIGGWLETLEGQRRLDDARRRFGVAFANAPIGMVIADLRGQVIQANDSFGEIVGRSSGDLVGALIGDLTHPDDRTRASEVLHQLQTEAEENVRIEQRFVRLDGEIRWVTVSASAMPGDAGAAGYLVGQIEDVTEQRAARERLTEMALHDALTGLPNRTLLQDRLALQLAAAVRDQRTTAVLFLDLDRFKIVNDSLGHAAGDELLQTIASRLCRAVRPNDTVARIGGDEFVIVCGGLRPAGDIDVVVDRVMAAVEAPVVLGGREVSVGASIGIAFAGPHEARTPDGLLRDADVAMYEAKSLGRGRAMPFTQPCADTAVDLLSLEADLRLAIHQADDTDRTEEGLLLHYQPLVDASGLTTGIETLVRWQHPERGLLAPAEFLPVAEDSDLIRPLGRWVLSQALSDWSDFGAMTISVNHTVDEIACPSFVDYVLNALQTHDVDPARLCIEVTETSVLQAQGSTMNALFQLADHGVQLAIDDFGAGYTSLAHLTGSPFTMLKIDRSLIIEPDEGTWVIVEAMLKVCDALGLDSVVEGVEDEGCLNRLRTMGCGRTQGFLHGCPRPLEVVLDSIHPRLERERRAGNR